MKKINKSNKVKDLNKQKNIVKTNNINYSRSSCKSIIKTPQVQDSMSSEQGVQDPSATESLNRIVDAGDNDNNHTYVYKTTNNVKQNSQVVNMDNDNDSLKTNFIHTSLLFPYVLNAIKSQSNSKAKTYNCRVCHEISKPSIPAQPLSVLRPNVLAPSSGSWHISLPSESLYAHVPYASLYQGNKQTHSKYTYNEYSHRPLICKNMFESYIEPYHDLSDQNLTANNDSFENSAPSSLSNSMINEIQALEEYEQKYNQEPTPKIPLATKATKSIHDIDAAIDKKRAKKQTSKKYRQNSKQTVIYNGNQKLMAFDRADGDIGYCCWH